ncbi:hypothetical protein WA026_015264, partial [Henosepilachna vigintioctopunctata]
IFPWCSLVSFRYGFRDSDDEWPVILIISCKFAPDCAKMLTAEERFEWLDIFCFFVSSPILSAAKRVHLLN